MFENPRRGRQARNFTTNVPKILDLKSSSEQIFSRKLPLGAHVRSIAGQLDLRIGQKPARCVTYLSLSSFTSLTLSWSPYLLVLLTFLITSFSARSGVFLEEFVHYESRPKKNGNEHPGFSRSYILSQHRLFISFFICIALCYPLIYPKDWLLGTSF